MNWEDKLQALWQAIQERAMTPDPVLLGVCAYLANKLGIPVVAIRLVALVCVYLWPIITTLVYIVLRFFLEPDRDTV